MTELPKVYMNWSSGKDASLALYYLQKRSHRVDKLVTSVSLLNDRVSMHGLRRTLLEQQAGATGLDLQIVELPESPSMEDYNRTMRKAVAKLRTEGYAHCGFGDIFLEDLRAYREAQLGPHGIKCHFPLWKKDTRALISDFINRGFKAVIICANVGLLDKSFVGREIDGNLINDLPTNVDPCGENGEFHTFCYDGPIFSEPVPFSVGEYVYREYPAPKQSDQPNSGTVGFWFCDLLPLNSVPSQQSSNKSI